MNHKQKIHYPNLKLGIIILISFLALLFFLPACQSPIVSVRNYNYLVKFIYDGKEYTVKTKYKCHYEDLQWFSERGADWHRRRESIPVKITGTVDDGTSYEIQPIPGPCSSSDCPQDRMCAPNTVDVTSILFVRDKMDQNKLYGFDHMRTTSDQHTIRITSSRLELEGTSYETFKKRGDQRHPNLLSKSYYTISADTIPSSEITRLGLRDYVNSRKNIWLRMGKEYPFIDWNDEDVAATVRYGKYLFPQTRQVMIAGEKTEQGWIIDKKSKIKASQWAIDPLNKREVESLDNKDNNILKQWVIYNKTRIQVPLNYSLTLHFYDPVDDEIILFRVVRRDITI